MSSLVADYGTDSDSDANDANTDAIKVQCDESVNTHGRNYLISKDEDNSSEDEDDDVSKVTQEKLPNPLGEKLPKPDLRDVSSSTVSKSADGPGSVFSNPFETAEMAKQSILEKHVKMTDAQLLTGKKGKICKAFKRGACRFGKNCKFSHDLDANLSLRYIGKQDDSVQDNSQSQHKSETSGRPRNRKFPQLPPPPKQKQGFMGTFQTLHSGTKHISTHQQRTHYAQQQQHMQAVGNDDDDDKFNVGDKRKKRGGLSESLVPPKKSMSSLTKQRVEQRPWTVKKKY